VATITEVRAKLVEQQRKWEMIKELSWMVDIGTVVFPNAELKIFMTASATIRAKKAMN
jgi:cytidylate kinase